MAGHAPELLSPRRRLWQWLAALSDLRISLYMLILALAVAAAIYFLDRRFFS